MLAASQALYSPCLYAHLPLCILASLRHPLQKDPASTQLPHQHNSRTVPQVSIPRSCCSKHQLLRLLLLHQRRAMGSGAVNKQCTQWLATQRRNRLMTPA
jgi:hypothetical protein